MATLTSTIDADDETIAITGDVSAAVRGGLYALEDELIILRSFGRTNVTPYRAPSGKYDRNVWIVDRGAEGTTAASHAAGTPVLAASDAFTTGSDLSSSAALPDGVDVFIGPYDPRGFTQTGTFTAPNYAILAPFAVNAPHTVTGARTYISAQSGNIDVGVYNATGSRLASTGSIACPATGERAVTFTASVVLQPRTLYYLAFSADNSTMGTAIKSSVINTSGYVNITALPLPATISVPGTGTLDNFMWVLTE